MSAPKLLHATRWLNLMERDGWIYASRRKPGEAPRVDAVNVIAIHGEVGQRRLVVLEEWRTVMQHWEFGLPAGLVEAGEPPLDCARRELVEESGLQPTWNGPVSGTLYPSAGMSDESFVYVTMGCEGVPAESPGVGSEKIKVHLLDRAGCARLIERSAAGQAALSGRLWPILASIVDSGMATGFVVDGA